MSLLGLVRHMTGVERNWFASAFASGDGQAPDYSNDDADSDFDDVAAADAAVDIAQLRDEVDRSRRIAFEYADLDTLGRGTRDGAQVSISLRWIYLHMIEEYARHNGHADFLRERIDGATGV
jgi:hypothetical protein